MSRVNSQRLLYILGVATFLVCLGWTIPYMVIVPFLRLRETFEMMSTGMPVLLGPDLTTMVPCALTVYYVLWGKSVRTFFSRWPAFAPFILVAFIAALGTTAMAHLAYVAAAHKLEHWSVVVVALAAFALWRIAIGVLAWKRPLDSFVVGFGGHRPQ